MTSFDTHYISHHFAFTGPRKEVVDIAIKDMDALKDMWSAYGLEPLMLKQPELRIIDVRGALDGANSILILQGHRLSTCDGAKDRYRLRENADTLVDQFKASGLPAPTVTKSYGAVMLGFLDRFRGINPS